MPRDRRGAQLALELEPALLQRLRAHAAADGRPVSTLVRRWIEAGLSGALQQEARPAGRDLADLADRLGRLEAEVAQLRRPAPPKQVSPKPPAEPAPIPQMGDATTGQPAGGITTAELAERTNTNRAAWNNWARDKRPGAVRKMPPEVGQWRLAGKGPAPGGGPDRWLWEPA